MVLSRPPQITRDLHPFESAFFLYQKRLNERLALPFTRYFYFKKRTPADLEWKRKIRQRLTPARDIGRYKGYGDEAWNDEVLVGAKESDLNWQVERLIDDAENSGAEGEPAATGAAAKKVDREAVDRPMPRVTEADKANDTKSLNRALQRTLYLLVKNKEGQWQFPQDRLSDEHLHGVRLQNPHEATKRRHINTCQAAQRILKQTGGPNMNTWLVGHIPIGHHEASYKEPKTVGNLTEHGIKTFFLKARIMAGQVNIKENKLGAEDFKWLAKEEVEKEVQKNYWNSIKNMLAER